MKNYLITLLAFFILLCFAFTLKAQVRLGVRAGTNFASLSGFSLSDNAQKESFPLLALMIPVEVPLSGPWHLQPELGYTQKGTKIGFKEGNNEATTTLQLNYIDLNLLTKVVLAEQSLKWGLLAGPGVSYGLNGRYKNSSTINGNTQKEEEKLQFGKEGLRRMDASLHFGTFLELPLSTGAVSFDARYQLGLINLSTVDGEEPIYNRGIQMSLGFVVPI